MKKLLTLFIVLSLLSVSAFADDLLISPAPSPEVTAEAEAEAAARKELLESLNKGIVPVTPELKYNDFISYMKIIDESDNKVLTEKFETFVQLIAYYYYGKLSQEDVFNLFKESVESVDINDMDTTYKAMFKMLDRFSYYLTPEEAEAFFEPTASKGIGIKMMWSEADGEREAGVYVEEVAKGSPADKAGILKGDKIVEFDTNDMRGLGFDALAAYSNSIDDAKETLDITLSRNGEEKSYTLERTSNKFSEYQIKYYPQKDLIYLDINSFMYDNTVDEIAAELDAAWSEGYDNIIIDLQSNGGGDVFIAAGILSKFTPYREVLFYMGRDGRKTTIPFISLGNGHDYDSVQVLVDGNTASSAEIFAYALNRIDSDTKIVGSTTFGKGVAQTVLTFVDEAAVGITTYVAYDSKGNTYNEVGIEPENKVFDRIEKNSLPENTPYFTSSSYSNAVEGAENIHVKALEIRLEAIGYLHESEVDEKWTDSTTRAIKALQKAVGLDETGALDDATYFAIMTAVKAYESTYHYTFTVFDYAYRYVPSKRK